MNVDTDSMSERELLVFCVQELASLHALRDELEPLLAKARKRGRLPVPPERTLTNG